MSSGISKFTSKNWKIIAFMFVLVISVVVLTESQKIELNEEEFVRDGDIIYMNTSRNVKYLGNESCRDCHLELFEAYIKTPTGRSMTKLDTTNIIEDYSIKEAVYDSSLNYYYEMVRKDGKFFQHEFRLDENNKVIHERWMEAQYVIGSGSNLRMYFYDENGMFYQLPLTWYVHKNKWDMSPGYREFNNVRFSRFVSAQCFTCHNAVMERLTTSKERYKKPYPIGINCESCHGPGELHILQSKGMKIDLPSENALTIVNPAKLSSQRQIDVCRQCHLQGKVWVQHDENDWFDFRPGMLLAENRSIYSPAATHKEAFKVANSAYRLSLSRCFKDSHGATTCSTCHDSHGMIKAASVDYNRQNCQKCHPPASLPGKSSKFDHSATDDCTPCHMKQTGTKHTLHGVINTDHWIRVDAEKDTIDWTSSRKYSENKPLVRLVPDVDADDNGKDIRKGIAYFEYYGEHDHRPAYLDSASKYISTGLKSNNNNAFGYYYLGRIFSVRGNERQAITYFNRAIEINPDYADAYFWLGNSYTNRKDGDNAIEVFRKAVHLMPGEPTYLENLGAALAERKQIDEALTVFERALTIDKLNPMTYYTLGNIHVFDLKQPEKALSYYKEVVILDPDFPNGCLNLGNTYVQLGQYENAIDCYKREIKASPDSPDAFLNLGHVYSLLENKSKAREAFQNALKLDPTSQLAKKSLNRLSFSE